MVGSSSSFKLDERKLETDRHSLVDISEGDSESIVGVVVRVLAPPSMRYFRMALSQSE